MAGTIDAESCDDCSFSSTPSSVIVEHRDLAAAYRLTD